MTVAKPTLQLKREGNFRKDRQGERIDSDYGGDLKRYGGLGADGREFWDWITEHTPPGVLVAVDSAALFGLCSWWQIWRGCNRALLKDPTSFKLGCQTAMAWKQFTKAASEFGLSPATRTKLRVIAFDRPEEDPLAEMARRYRGDAG